MPLLMTSLGPSGIFLHWILLYIGSRAVFLHDCPLLTLWFSTLKSIQKLMLLEALAPAEFPLGFLLHSCGKTLPNGKKTPGLSCQGMKDSLLLMERHD